MNSVLQIGDCEMKLDELAQPLPWIEHESASRMGLYTLDFLQAGTGLSFLGLLKRFREERTPPAYVFLNSLANSRASDPRDHVYAFLSVVEVDYALSVAQTFAVAARGLIERGGLSIFSTLPISTPRPITGGSSLTNYPPGFRTGLLDKHSDRFYLSRQKSSTTLRHICTHIKTILNFHGTNFLWKER